MGAEELRLLHKTMGYTSNPHEALAHEPEAISAEEQAELTRRRERDVVDTRRREWKRCRERIEAELREVRLPRELGSDVRVLLRQLDRISSRL